MSPLGEISSIWVKILLFGLILTMIIAMFCWEGIPDNPCILEKLDIIISGKIVNTG